MEDVVVSRVIQASSLPYEGDRDRGLMDLRNRADSQWLLYLRLYRLVR